jgi:predicted DNA-binding antitoxin AbrB/MazE fold protein
MKQAIDAIYENGTFRPVDANGLNLSEGQRVRITVDERDIQELLRQATSVYDGLSEEEIDQIEAIALDRR